MEFISVLKTGNDKLISEAIEQFQYDYYTKDDVCNTIDLGFAVPNFDILMNVIGCNDCGDPFIYESFGDNAYYKELKIFSTKIVGLYFSRMEEFGGDIGISDMDAMKCSIIITNDIEAETKKIINIYTHKSLIIEKKNQLRDIDKDDYER